MKNKLFTGFMVMTILTLCVSIAFSAYHHMDEQDSDHFIDVYPSKRHTKLDSCALCHSGGQYEKKPGKFITMGSCQWCHYKYGYDGSGNIVETLNAYGKDYYLKGRNANAIEEIALLDSDKDGFSNIDEINALRYPGDENDNPDKRVAPFRVYSKSDLQRLPQHTQFMLMNTHRSGDFYAEYTGVPIEDLLADAGILDTATGITVYAPDGWSTYHPLEVVEDPSLYHINGSYQQAIYYYDPSADWCDYNSPKCSLYQHESPIFVSGGLKALLAIQRDGVDLTTGILNVENKLDGSGPYRIVVPQKAHCAPDQSATSENQNVVWPFNDSWDHNAGYCTRSVTIIKVEPLPEGTTDINFMEAGWQFIEDKKIIIYGAIEELTGSLSGKLYLFEENTKKPFSGVTVTIAETGQTATSGEKGEFYIEEVPMGTVTVSIQHENHLLMMLDEVGIEENQNTLLPVLTFPEQHNGWDINNDNRVSLVDIVHWFKVLAGLPFNE